MSAYEVGGSELAAIHRENNKKKWFCYFTGFLEGVISSGRIETGEIEPLIVQCKEFIQNVGDPDASDILQDFECDLLDFASLKDASEHRAKQIDIDCRKSSRNRLNGFCAGIACDNRITLREAKEALERIRNLPQDACDGTTLALEVTLADAVEDGDISPAEAEDICSAISQIVGESFSDTGVSSLGGMPNLVFLAFEEIAGELAGKTFVLTGNFSVRPRSIVEKSLVSLGAQISRSVTKQTDYMIVAMEASRDWIETHQGMKIRQARKYQEATGRPAILAEFDVLRSLKLP